MLATSIHPLVKKWDFSECQCIGLMYTIINTVCPRLLSEFHANALIHLLNTKISVVQLLASGGKTDKLTYTIF